MLTKLLPKVLGRLVCNLDFRRWRVSVGFGPELVAVASGGATLPTPLISTPNINLISWSATISTNIPEGLDD